MTTELKAILNEHLNDNEIANAFFHDDFPTDLEPGDYQEDEVVEFCKLLAEKGVVVENEDSHGGEGQGDEFWSVYSFSHGDAKVYVKFDGWYQSYNGSEYTDCFYVEPKQVQVTRYEKV